MRVLGWKARVRNESKGARTRSAVGRASCTIDRSCVIIHKRFECEHTCWDPKAGFDVGCEPSGACRGAVNLVKLCCKLQLPTTTTTLWRLNPA